MFRGIVRFSSRWTSVQRFRLVSFIVILLGTLVIGKWMADQIKTSIINESASTTALYLDSFIVPHLQELGQSKTLSPEHIEILNKQLTETNLGRHIVTVKVWDKDGLILYSNHPSLIGRSFPGADDLSAAWKGQVMAVISDLEDDENLEERHLYDRLLEIYIPVRLHGTHNVIAVAEFYQEMEGLEAEIASAQNQSWLALGISMAVLYLLLIGFFQLANNRIRRQEIALKNHVAQLTEVLTFNEELDEGVRRAAANTAALNENLLRRTSAELHKGPMEKISQALLQFEQAMIENESCRLDNLNNKCNDSLPIVHKAITAALQEMSAIATGLGLPELDNLSLPEVIARVTHSHEQITGTKVTVSMGDLPEHATLPIKITAYRFIQEALNNAYRHAGGASQTARITYEDDRLHIEVSDRGPGFDIARPIEWSEHLGLAGMRERVESMGGIFSIESWINEGTKVVADLFLQTSGEVANG